MRSDKSFGNNGLFEIPYTRNATLTVVVSDKLGWDHVSVSMPTLTPTWAMMCHIKELFFEDDEVVVQFHPKKSDYVNFHKHCLHMWRLRDIAFPTPPTCLVGPK